MSKPLSSSLTTPTASEGAGRGGDQLAAQLAAAQAVLATLSKTMAAMGRSVSGDDEHREKRRGGEGEAREAATFPTLPTHPTSLSLASGEGGAHSAGGGFGHTADPAEPAGAASASAPAPAPAPHPAPTLLERTLEREPSFYSLPSTTSAAGRAFPLLSGGGDAPSPGGDEIDRLRAEVESLTRARRALALDVKKKEAALVERDAEVTVLKQKLVRVSRSVFADA